MDKVLVPYVDAAALVRQLSPASRKTAAETESKLPFGAGVFALITRTLASSRW